MLAARLPAGRRRRRRARRRQRRGARPRWRGAMPTASSKGRSSRRRDALPAAGALGRRRHRDRRRPLPLSAGARRPRCLAARRGHAPAAVRGDGRDAARAARRGRHRASRSGRRTPRGSAWSATSTTGTAAATRCGCAASAASGRSSCPASAPGSAYKYEIVALRRPGRCRRRPTRMRCRPSCGRPPRASSARCRRPRRCRPSARGANALDAPISIYEVHLGSWRRHARGRQSLPELGRARRRAGAVRARAWASRTSSCCRSASIRSTARGATSRSACTRRPRASATAAGFRRFVDALPCRRARRAARLGAGALSERCARPGAVRRHAALRARRPARRLPPGLEHADLQLRPHRGPQLPGRATRCSGSSATASTACASTRWRRCCTATTAARPASGCRTSTAGARTSRRSRS